MLKGGQETIIDPVRFTCLIFVGLDFEFWSLDLGLLDLDVFFG